MTAAIKRAAWLVALGEARLRVHLARRDVDRRAAELQVRIAEIVIDALETEARS